MDLSADLRALTAAYDDAGRVLTDTRRTFETATTAYHARRRYAPRGAETAAARAAWAIAGQEWMAALIARETARDALAAERRDVDHAAEDHFLTPTRSAR
jgi:hypothetical protein